MTFIDLLNDTIGKELDDYKVTEIGDALYINLDEDRRIKISFDDMHVADQYDAILLRLISKTGGKLDSKAIRFSDIFDSPKDKYVWDWRNIDWYAKPTPADKQKLAKQIMNYIEIWK